MTEQKISVEFSIKDREKFMAWLQGVTDNNDENGIVIGYRADDQVHRREALEKFANEMELVLRRHDHKTAWRQRPIEALMRLFFLEIEEFKVAYEFFEISEAKKELVDCANYALILYDRLSVYDADTLVSEALRKQAAE